VGEQQNADDYNTNTYPQVLKTLDKVIDGTPQIQTFETVIATSVRQPNRRASDAELGWAMCSPLLLKPEFARPTETVDIVLMIQRLRMDGVSSFWSKKSLSRVSERLIQAALS
jgi:hypothetical protein